MRNLKMLEKVVELWEKRERIDGRPLPPQMVEVVRGGIKELDHYIEKTQNLRARAQEILGRIEG